MPTLKDLWALKWVRIVAIAAAALILVSLFGNLRSCRSTDYWKGQADLQAKKIASMFTKEDIEKAVAARDKERDAREAELQGHIDSSETVIAGAQEKIEGKDVEIRKLKAKVAEAADLPAKVEAQKEIIAKLEEKVELKDTQLLERGREIKELTDARAQDKADYDKLKIDLTNATDGWDGCKKALEIQKNVSLGLERDKRALKFQAALGKVGSIALLALGIYAVAK